MHDSTIVDADVLERLRASILVLYKLIDGVDGQVLIDDDTRNQMRKQIKFANKQVNSLQRASKPRDGDIIRIVDEQFEVKRVQ